MKPEQYYLLIILPIILAECIVIRPGLKQCIALATATLTLILVLSILARKILY